MEINDAPAIQQAHPAIIVIENLFILFFSLELALRFGAFRRRGSYRSEGNGERLETGDVVLFCCELLKVVVEKCKSRPETCQWWTSHQLTLGSWPAMIAPCWIADLASREGDFTGVLRIGGVRMGTYISAEEVSIGMKVWIPDFFSREQLVTVYSFVACQSSDGSTFVLPQDQSTWYAHNPISIVNYQHIKEVCSGMGGLGLGAAKTGIRTVAYLDHCALACEALIKNGANNVIHGDLCNPQDIARLHGASDHRRTVLGAGFPCQPYSSQGDNRGKHDPRSKVFLATLQAAWLTQASAVILECVPGVQNHGFINEHLNELATLMGFQLKTIVLSLQDQWPCNRVRWWAILAPKEFDLTDFVPWGKDIHFSTIQHVIPDWPLWDTVAEKQLQLDEVELTFYTDSNYGQAALLCTIPVNYKFPGDARAGLVLIGQAVQAYYGWEPLCQPQTLIQSTKHELLWQKTTMDTTFTSFVKDTRQCKTCFKQKNALPNSPNNCSSGMETDRCQLMPSFKIEEQHFVLEPHALEAITNLDPSILTTIIFAFDGHWALLVAEPDEHCFKATIFDGLDHRAHEGGHYIATTLASQWNIPCKCIQSLTYYHQQDNYTCGTIALAHLAAVLDLWPESNQPDIATWHRHLQAGNPTNEYIHAANGPCNEEEVLKQLTAILTDKGVPLDRVEERATHAIKKLGLSSIAEALASKQTWSALKALGSRPSSPFQWIRHDELLKKVQLKAASQFGISTSVKKKDKNKPERASEGKAECNITPSELQLIPGTFTGEDGIPIEALSIHNLSKGRTGIGFATISEAAPYLKEGIQLSTGPLAILTTTCIPPTLCGQLPTENILFPAKHIATQEPILIHGSIIQLGQVMVARPVRNTLPDVAPIATCTIKLAIYQDQWANPWTTFVEGPMRQVMQHYPIMTLCRSEGCGDTCRKFHPPVDEEQVTSVILDIWGRQWVNAQGARVAFHNLLNLSGTDGLYVDPRDSTGRSPDEQFGAKPAADRLQQAEERIKATVTASLQKQIDQWQQPSGWDTDQNMEGDDRDKLDTRFQFLESSVAELRQQNVKFEQWFGDAAEANQVTNRQINALATQVQTQQLELGNLNKTVHDHNAEIRREMSAGFGNIEALLSKKHRTD
ncbi:unnamed protein product [Effrenium voratum]|nr:unnamed protein product [Effrenium voratum]